MMARADAPSRPRTARKAADQKRLIGRRIKNQHSDPEASRGSWDAMLDRAAVHEWGFRPSAMQYIDCRYRAVASVLGFTLKRWKPLLPLRSIIYITEGSPSPSCVLVTRTTSTLPRAAFIKLHPFNNHHESIPHPPSCF